MIQVKLEIHQKKKALKHRMQETVTYLGSDLNTSIKKQPTKKFTEIGNKLLKNPLTI